MLQTQPYILPKPLAELLEDAILFGHTREVDAVLKIINIDDEFPSDLRYGIEALRYFREYYGVKGIREPGEHLQKQKATLMENAWSAELLDKIKRVRSNDQTKRVIL